MLADYAGSLPERGNSKSRYFDDIQEKSGPQIRRPDCRNRETGAYLVKFSWAVKGAAFPVTRLGCILPWLPEGGKNPRWESTFFSCSLRGKGHDLASQASAD
jgi:hypothetical protein